MLDEAKRQGLHALADADVPTWVSAGIDERARPIAARVARARAFLADLLGLVPDVQLLILTQADWGGRAAHPIYGMPNSDRGTLCVAGEPNDFWMAFVDLLDDDAVMRLQHMYPDRRGGIDLAPFFDLLAIHELGHAFQTAGGVRFPRLWLSELFCNVSLDAYVVGEEPELLPALATFPHLVAEVPGSRLPYRTVRDFELLYDSMPGPNYGWFQCRLHVAARRLVDESGPVVVRRLWDAFRIGNAQLAQKLGDVHPQLGLLAEEFDREQPPLESVSPI
jgi:hypothetical protein